MSTVNKNPTSKTQSANVEVNAANQVEVDGITINLKNRYLAALLAFLWPGAGHWYQGRYGKAGLFSTCILLLFVVGMVLGSGRVVYASWIAQDYRWQYVIQAGVGIPAAPAAVQWYRDRNQQPRLWNGWMARPRSMEDLSDWHEQTSAGFDLGTLFTMVAGLLNILVVFDAFSGPMVFSSQREKKEKATKK